MVFQLVVGTVVKMQSQAWERRVERLGISAIFFASAVRKWCRAGWSFCRKCRHAGSVFQERALCMPPHEARIRPGCWSEGADRHHQVDYYGHLDFTPSSRVIDDIVKTQFDSGKDSAIIALFRKAHVAELVDAHGSGPCAARCGGSSPSVGTTLPDRQSQNAAAFAKGMRRFAVHTLYPVQPRCSDALSKRSPAPRHSHCAFPIHCDHWQHPLHASTFVLKRTLTCGVNRLCSAQ